MGLVQSSYLNNELSSLRFPINGAGTPEGGRNASDSLTIMVVNRTHH